MPLTLLILCSFLLLNVVMNNPNSTLSVVLSVMPFLSPILMTLRVAMETPPFWQIALAIAVNAAAIAALVWLASRVYRVGMLMYGKRATLPELLRWLRYS